LVAVSAVAKNSGLGTLIHFNPEHTLPAHAAIRTEDADRFRDYVDNWAEYNHDLAKSESPSRSRCLASERRQDGSGKGQQSLPRLVAWRRQVDAGRPRNNHS
jgi:hypothetical protein